MDIRKENKVGKIVIYGRVSSAGQKEDLANQLSFLRDFANARGLIVDDVLTDIGNGLNYKRKKWNALLEDCFEGNVSTIIIAHKDRFVRFGYDWFASFLKKRGVEILVVKNDTLSPQQELVEDLISIIHVFSCRIYGLRKYKKKNTRRKYRRMKNLKKAFKTEVLLSNLQVDKVNRTIGTCRYVYNLYLHTAQEYYKKTKKHLSGYEFSKWLNNVHAKETDQWIKDVSSKAVKQAIMNGDKAFKNFFKGLAKFPRFKKKKNQDVKAYFPKNNPTDLTVERHRVKVPTIGWVRLKEFGYIPTGTTVINCTLSQKAGRYFISVLCEIEEVREIYVPEHDGIGNDLGISTFAVCSHHVQFKNINQTEQVAKLEKNLKRQQRKLSRSYEQNKNRERGEFCAKNRQKQLIVVQKLHARLANIRKEYIRSVVDTLVKTKPIYLTIEDLNVTGMMKNRHLSKSIAQQSFAAFREWLTAKCGEKGIELRVVDRWYPSSKLCSTCGSKKTKLSLSERTFSCDNCDTILDRDFNASLNLKYAKEYTVIT